MFTISHRLHALSAIIRAGCSHAETLASIGSNGFLELAKNKSLGIAQQTWLHRGFMFSTILNPSALATGYALNVRVVNARAFKSCAAKFTNFATKSSKSRWFGTTKSFVDYSTKPSARHLEGLTT
jgi:hypothetical protein